MDAVNEKIVRFIRRHHVLTLATEFGGQPWCSNMFYSYDEVKNIFIIASEEKTRHIREVMGNSRVAASIVLESKFVGRLQGLQMTGQMVKEGYDQKELVNKYLKRFPYAILADVNLWVLRPDSFKFTDNTLGFGKKLYWQDYE